MRIDIANEQKRLIDENNGSIPRDLQSKLMNYANSYEIFSDEERNKINSIVGGLKTQGKTPDEAVNDLLSDFGI